MISAEQLAARLGAKQTASGWIATCPVPTHGGDGTDSNPSLSIDRGENGKVLLNCFAGCTFEQIVAAMGLSPADLFAGGAARSTKIIATYDYRDEHGELRFQCLRKDPKGFFQRRPDGSDGWINDLRGVSLVPYRLLELLAADPNATVFVPEGEKDVDRLVTRGLIATTNPMGALRWRPEYNKYFKDRHVVIIPDNDAAGLRHAWRVAEQLHPVARDVRLVELPDLPPHGDVSTFFDKGGNRERLLGLVEKTPLLNALQIEFHRAQEAAAEGAVNTKFLDDLRGLTPDDPDLSQRLSAIRAGLPPLSQTDHAVLREAAIRALADAGFNSPARLADAVLGQRPRDDSGNNKQGESVTFEELEPWDDPVDGATLLTELVDLFKHYIVLPMHGAVVLALWAVLTHVFDSFDICPFLAVLSPTMRCGKSRVLEILSVVVRRPLVASNISPAAIYRAIDAWRPTLLCDEMDTQLGGENKELIGIIDSGHPRRLAYVFRAEGDNHEPRRFSTWSPKVLALIGVPPQTIEDRSIILRMRRRTNDEPIGKLRITKLDAECIGLRRRLLRWGLDNTEALATADPPVPDVLDDRAADNWRALLAVAERVGGAWPQLAKDAALAATTTPRDVVMGVALLEDFRTLFDTLGDKISSEEVVNRLVAMAERPWPEGGKNGRPITQRGVAELLKPFDIRPKSVRLSKTNVLKGYDRADFEEAFSRYLGKPSKPNEQPAEPEGETLRI